ncbi:neutral/alkaline non-lysosomal ceramidase N-terminal domain-containing protein [Sutcliffiella sp. NPDC057660]|uniref:neutral/alkaline non-lysosomal ceramidase N-terminal domain-containing protein n=1 Tax=Sutcliffiella sp. NPDC057660 TaxID=3346199 RepID=UPI0036A83CE2
MPLLLGTHQMDITPTLPVQLAGFAHRKGKAREVHSPLYLKTFYFEIEAQASVILIGDVIWWDTELVQKWRRALSEKFHINPERICFHATHNHSGPQTSFAFTSLLGDADPHYLDSLEAVIIESVGAAKNDKELVTATRRNTSCEIGVNRRTPKGEKIVMEPNPEAFVDHAVSIISFQKENSEVKGILIHYACHPTATDANVVSSEFPGRCCSLIQNQYGNAVIGFLQGCSGEVRPALIKKKEFYRGTTSDMEELGAKLATSVLDAMKEQEGESLEMTFLEAKVMSVPLFFQEGYPAAREMEEGVLEIWKEHVKKNWPPHRLIKLELQVLQLGKELSLVCFNGEMVQSYGEYVKELCPGSLALGYSNGMIGYIPTAEQIQKGGYESEGFIYYFGLPAPFQEGIEVRIRQAIKNSLVGDGNDG